MSQHNEKIVSGIFNSRPDAEQAIAELRTMGVPDNAYRWSLNRTKTAPQLPLAASTLTSNDIWQVFQRFNGHSSSQKASMTARPTADMA